MTQKPAHTAGPVGQPRLTEPRLRILRAAAKDKLGLVERPYLTGFERVSWDKNAAYLSNRFLLSPYVHGGFEITDAGRAALAKAEGRS